jgi:hypothetical protein
MMKKYPNFFPAVLSSCLLVAFACIAQAACDDSGNAVKEPAPGVDSGPSTEAGPGPGPGVDGSTGDAAGDGAPSDCFTNPQNHFEIINACTNATKIAKNPVLTKLLPDGGLPPLN